MHSAKCKHGFVDSLSLPQSTCSSRKSYASDGAIPLHEPPFSLRIFRVMRRNFPTQARRGPSWWDRVHHTKCNSHLHQRSNSHHLVAWAGNQSCFIAGSLFEAHASMWSRNRIVYAFSFCLVAVCDYAWINHSKCSRMHVCRYLGV